MLPFGIITLLLSFFFSDNDSDISRSYNIIAGFILLPVLISAVYKPLSRYINKIYINNEYVIKWTTSLLPAIILALIIIVEIIFLN